MHAEVIKSIFRHNGYYDEHILLRLLHLSVKICVETNCMVMVLISHQIVTFPQPFFWLGKFSFILKTFLNSYVISSQIFHSSSTEFWFFLWFFMKASSSFIFQWV